MEMAKKQEYESDLTEAQIDMLVDLARQYKAGTRKGVPAERVFAELRKKYDLPKV